MKNIETSIGQRLKKARLERGISQADLCDGICSPSTISQLEGDKFIPSVEILKKLSERLSLPLQELLTTHEQQMEIRVQIEIIRAYVEAQNFDYALSMIDTLIIKEELLEHQKRELLISKSECFIGLKRPQEAIELLLQLQKKMELDREPEDRSLARVYDKLGTAYYYAQDVINSYANYLRAYRIIMRFPEIDFLTASITYNLGNVCRAMGYNEEAITYLNSAYEFLKNYNNPKIIASTFFALGISYSNIGKLDLAEEFLRKSQTLYEMSNSLHFAQLVRQKYAFDILSQHRLEDALSELQKCKEEFLRLGDVSSVCYAIGRSAMLNMEHDRMEDVEKELTEGLALIRSKELNENQFTFTGNHANEDGQYAYFYLACAKFSLLKKNYKDSQFYANKASEIYAKLGLIQDAAETLQISAEAYYQSGDLYQAFVITKEANNLLIKNRGR